MAIEIKRFKNEDGREGSYAPIGGGLIKMLFDDGDMVIVRDLDYVAPDEPENGTKVRPAPMERAWPRVLVSQIPSIIEKLLLGTGDPRYAVLMFVPLDSVDREHVNLQYSMENGVVGLDWVLLGERNIKDAEAIKAFALSRGFEFKNREINQVEFLRTEEPGIAELGMSLITDFYHYRPTTRIKLLVEGFEWEAPLIK